MSKQPEALRLTKDLKEASEQASDEPTTYLLEASQELVRLHTANLELATALKRMVEAFCEKPHEFSGEQQQRAETFARTSLAKHGV